MKKETEEVKRQEPKEKLIRLDAGQLKAKNPKPQAPAPHWGRKRKRQKP